MSHRIWKNLFSLHHPKHKRVTPLICLYEHHVSRKALLKSWNWFNFPLFDKSYSFVTWMRTSQEFTFLGPLHHETKGLFLKWGVCSDSSHTSSKTTSYEANKVARNSSELQSKSILKKHIFSFTFEKTKVWTQSYRVYRACKELSTLFWIKRVKI